jgi:hypothetical protein
MTGEATEFLRASAGGCRRLTRRASIAERAAFAAGSAAGKSGDSSFSGGLRNEPKRAAEGSGTESRNLTTYLKIAQTNRKSAGWPETYNVL